MRKNHSSVYFGIRHATVNDTVSEGGPPPPTIPKSRTPPQISATFYFVLERRTPRCWFHNDRWHEGQLGARQNFPKPSSLFPPLNTDFGVEHKIEHTA